MVAVGEHQNSGYLVLAISAGLWWPDGNISCCPGAGEQEPESHCGKHKATVEIDIRPLHSHTGYSRSMEHGKKLLAVRRWSRLWEANAAMTSCVSRSFDFCAITNLYLLRERTPFNVTTMAMARGGLSCDVKGVLSPHSRTSFCVRGFSLRLMILD